MRPSGQTPHVIGRYVLHGEIASGGMATVHLGRLKGAVGFARTVAIKRLHAQYSKDPDFVAMFLDEARVTARIQHPNVVSTMDVVSIDDEIFVVMEYVLGETLARLLRATRAEGDRVPPRIVAAIVAGLLHGLHAAHDAKNEENEPLGLVHRDVSPQNVIVGKDGIARVLDFGVAKAVGRMQTTRDGQLKGKLTYMAPEQLQGQQVTRRTDVYAAGIVLWEALTGERLFAGDNEAHVLSNVLNANVLPPSAVVSDISPAFDAITMRALSRDQKLRYATAQEMALAIERTGEVALTTEVASWLAQVAGAAIAERAKRVAQIESSANAVNIEEAPEPVREVPPSQRSMMSVTASHAAELAVSKQPAITRWLLALAAVAVLLSILLLVILTRTPGDVPASAATGPLTFPPDRHNGVGEVEAAPIVTPPATPAPSAAPTPAPSPLAVAPVAPPTASEAPTVIVTAAPVEPSSLPAVSATAAAPPTHPRPITRPTAPPTPATAPAPSRRCDPPYAIDAQGHKIFKVECL